MVNPKGYGLKAFDLGGHGSIEPVTISNPDGINLTAYAVRGASEHFVTLINKEHGAGAREANVTIAAPGAAERADGDLPYRSGPRCRGENRRDARRRNHQRRRPVAWQMEAARRNSTLNSGHSPRMRP